MPTRAWATWEKGWRTTPSQSSRAFRTLRSSPERRRLHTRTSKATAAQDRALAWFVNYTRGGRGAGGHGIRRRAIATSRRLYTAGTRGRRPHCRREDAQVSSDRDDPVVAADLELPRSFYYGSSRGRPRARRPSAAIGCRGYSAFVADSIRAAVCPWAGLAEPRRNFCVPSPI